MKKSIKKLQKILKLEAERGYDNRAVVGGLNRILDTWEVEARSDGLPEDLVQAIGIRLRDYPQLSEISRAEALQGLWNHLQTADELPADSELSPMPVTHKPQPRTGTKPEETQPEVSPAHPVPPPTPKEVAEPVIEVAALPAHTPPTPEEPPAALDAPVTILPNVGPRNAQNLARLDLHNLRDMLYNFPRRYDDYSKLMPINRLSYGEEVTVIGSILNVHTRSIRGGSTKVVETIISDSTGKLRVTWFNQIWIAKRLSPGMQISISGKVDQYLGRLVMTNPDWERIDQQQLNTNRIVPVYRLTDKITQKWLRRMMNQVVSHWADRVPDHLPEHIRQSADLINLNTALMQVHFPDSWELLRAARYRLAFDEIFLLQVGVQRQKKDWEQRTGRVFETADDWLTDQINRLPFQLTGSQGRALDDIKKDLASGHPMNRLLQGDVGSGKTVVAAIAIAMVVRHGAQAAVMAPTSILAEQHYKNLLQLLGGPDGPLAMDQIHLMIGATTEAEKNAIREGLADGSIKLVVGTHALIEDPVEFSDLELAIIDEQHRFGVGQRATLRSKGTNPHLLVMTATPIPRSLALTIYGDLDLSVMDEMPPGRQEVSTHVLNPLERERAYRLINSQIETGHQAFIIYPLVEESDKSDSKAAVDEHSRLQNEVFKHYKVGLLHGRLRPEEKEAVMAGFHAREYQILVATSVVEVGIDIPNATVMLIEGADRFGLAQLHQFRGRVGRGGDKAYCLLIPESADAIENERLQVMTQTNDGFILAEHDLNQRGPGEFLGTRQSGYAEFQLASLTDIQMIEKARRYAHTLFDTDPDLTNPEHQALKAALERVWNGEQADIS